MLGLKKTDLEQLEGQLKGLDKPVLSSVSRDKVKNSLMSSLQRASKEQESLPSSLASLANSLRALGIFVVPSSLLKMRVRERLYENMQPRSAFGFTSFAKALSSAMVFVLVLSSFFFFAFDANVTQAQNLTHISALSGDVVILRDGRELKAKPGVGLEESDKVLTSSGAAATIVYHDDSVTRLSENTKLSIQRLVDNEETQVEVSVESGNVWAHVPALSGEDSYFGLHFADKFAEVPKKAAFNVQVKDDEPAQLEVFQSVVYLEDEPVINGYKAQVESDEKTRIARLSDDDKFEEWVKVNMFEDQKYVDDVLAKAIADVKVDESDQTEILALTDLDSSDLESLSTFERATQRKKDFDLRLSEYGILLSEGRQDEAAERLLYIRGLVDLLLGDIAAIENSDEAAQLRSDLDKSLLLHKKALTLISANNDAEDLLYDVETGLATSDEEVKQIELARAADSLTDAVDLLEEGHVKEVKAELVEAKELVKTSEDSELQEKNESLLSALETEQKRNNAKASASSRVAPAATSQAKNSLPPQFQLNFQKDNLVP